MKPIFRIEDVHGVGMYWSNVAEITDCVGYCLDPNLHPHPFADTRLQSNLPSDYNMTDYLFGVEDPTLIQVWVVEERVLQWLHSKGFRLGIYFPSSVATGDSESMFLKSGEFLKPPIFRNLLVAKEYFNWFSEARD